MDEVYVAALLMSALTLGFGTVLALAHRYLRVEEDARLPRIESLLGGSNCGACGQPGCRAFAEALLRKQAEPAQCTVSPPEAIEELAVLLGVAAGRMQKRVARVHCGGGRSAVQRVAEYRGEPTCASAFRAQRGGRACAWGCLGLADCARACTFEAIRMNDEELPVVDPERCTACGDCVTACPASLIALQPLDEPLVVQCSSPLTGDRARASCAVACDACGRCGLDAPAGVIEMEAGLPRVRRPERAPEACTYRCPTGAIAWVPGAQFDYHVPISALTRQRD